MKRFAFIHIQYPHRFSRVKYMNDNFDRLMFNVTGKAHTRIKIDTLNDYDFIWMYLITGANKQNYKGMDWYDFPRYLREKGVETPIGIQLDYWGGDRSIMGNQMQLVERNVDAFIHATNRGWNTDKPVFYQHFPLRKMEPVNWIPYKDKIKRAVGIKRLYGGNGQSENIAKSMNLPMMMLRDNVKPLHGIKYINYLANSLIGLDYNNRYWGWSRMVFEAVWSGTPVVGDAWRKGCQIVSPELTGLNPKEILSVISNETEYNKIRQAGFERAKEHVSEKACTERIKGMLSQFCDNL